MNYENKHNEEIIRATQLWENGDITRENLEYIFPELRESEDESIRKDLIEWIEEFPDSIWRGHYTKDVITWLEKQSEQKTTNNVESTFKVGDWIISKYMHLVMQILNNNNGFYKTVEIDGTERNDSYDYIERNFKLWTIADAKDGDILWHSDSASNGIFIFKEIRHDGKVLCYCDYDSEDHFCNGEYHTCCWSTDKYIKPATKEQRDHLFEKMHEASYEWDKEKKELRKIKNQGEQKSVDVTRENTNHHEGWLNIYKTNDFYSIGCVYECKNDALSSVSSKNTSNYIATVKIEWEEQQ